MSDYSHRLSILKKRLRLNGRVVVLSLEVEYWDSLSDIARITGSTPTEILSGYLSELDALAVLKGRRCLLFSNYVRTRMVDFYRSRTPPGPEDDSATAGSVRAA